MPLADSGVELLCVLAVLAILALLLYPLHASRAPDARMAFLLALLERAAGEDHDGPSACSGARLGAPNRDPGEPLDYRASSAAPTPAAGKVKKKDDPRPGSLSTRTSPP